MNDKELMATRDRVMKALTDLSAAARASKEIKLTRLSSDLYYAANRAWHELDGVRRRQKGDAA